MEALFDCILTLNLIGTTVVFYVTARIYLFPHLGRLDPRSVLIPILLLRSLRHLGLMFLTRGATYQGLPSQFAYPAALGDLLTAVLAFVSIFPVRRQFGDGATARMAVQSLWHGGFARGDHDGDGLPSASIHGTSLLDTRDLGARVVGDSLPHLRSPLEILAQ
jgi:hypothetical protein